MKTAVTQTSISAFNRIDRTSLRGRIAAHIKERTESGYRSWIAQIARDLGLEKSTVSARFNELKKDPFTFDGEQFYRLEFAEKKVDPITLITVETWGMVNAHNPGEQIKLFQ